MKNFTLAGPLRRTWIALGYSLALASCGGDGDGTIGGGPTQTVLSIGTDMPAGIGSIEARVIAPSGSTATSTATLGPGQLPPPRTLAVVHGGSTLAPYRVELSARAQDGNPVNVSRTALFTMQEGRAQRVELSLDAACVDVSCSSGLTCDGGVCIDATVSGTTIDAGGGPDGGQTALQGNFLPGTVRF